MFSFLLLYYFFSFFIYFYLSSSYSTFLFSFSYNSSFSFFLFIIFPSSSLLVSFSYSLFLFFTPFIFFFSSPPFPSIFFSILFLFVSSFLFPNSLFFCGCFYCCCWSLLYVFVLSCQHLYISSHNMVRVEPHSQTVWGCSHPWTGQHNQDPVTTGVQITHTWNITQGGSSLETEESAPSGPTRHLLHKAAPQRLGITAFLSDTKKQTKRQLKWGGKETALRWKDRRTLQKKLTEMEASKLSVIEVRVMIIRMFKELSENYKELYQHEKRQRNHE